MGLINGMGSTESPGLVRGLECGLRASGCMLVGAGGGGLLVDADRD